MLYSYRWHYVYLILKLLCFNFFTLGDWNQAKEMEKRAAENESDDLKTIQETRKKRLVKKPAKYSPSSFLLENRKRAHSSSSDDNSKVVESISPVISKQKRSSDNLENIPQQRQKPRYPVVLDSSPSNGGEGKLNYILRDNTVSFIFSIFIIRIHWSSTPIYRISSHSAFRYQL